MSMRIGLVALAFATATHVVLDASLQADEHKPAVSLILLKASAKRNGPDMLFRCDLRLDNATGKDLIVRTYFFSAFDGLELVVTDKQGKTLKQQPYTYHQSPYGELSDYPLKPGSTKDQIRFPIPDLPKGVRDVKVRLVGTLLRSTYKRLLSTETIEVKLQE